jgi:WD40 repeat protein
VTLYEILGVNNEASEEELRQAYRQLARTHHPDVSTDPKAHELMAKINAAFEVLIDPSRRIEYDAKLSDGGVRDPYDVRRQAPKGQFVQATLVHRMQEHKTPIYSLSFVPNSEILVSSAFDNELLFWDLKRAEVMKRSKLEGGVVSTIQAVHEDRVVAAGCSENTICFWNIEKGSTHSWRSNTQDWVCSVSLSPDGSKLAYGTVNSKLGVLDTKTGEPFFANVFHKHSVTASAWCPMGTYLATGGGDATVRIWHPTEGVELHHIPNIRSTVTAIAFSPRAEMIAIAAVDLSIRVFSPRDPGFFKVLFGHHRPIEALAFHPSGRLLASIGRDGCVGLWNVSEGVGHSKIETSHQALNGLAFSTDGRFLAVGGLDKVHRVWSLSFNS